MHVICQCIHMPVLCPVDVPSHHGNVEESEQVTTMNFKYFLVSSGKVHVQCTCICMVANNYLRS